MEENIQEKQPGDQAENIFDDHVEFTLASQGQRFLNLLIDVLLMRFLLSKATGYLLAYLLLAIAPDFLTELAYEVEGEKSWRFWVASIALGYINYLIYYTICEKAFKGYTLGKLITGTRAIREDGQELSFKDTLLRTLCRMIPFEVFSGFGARPWHDTITKTMVVKSR
ncbi:MAG TPA: RDD family protein [Chitinophagaceae bacterium]|jgi:uncharacterized RDD family membrane protein YckC|nr:RDD family protein [Chitinophagaceae bacterium]